MSGNVYGSGKIEEIQKFKNSKIQKKRKHLISDQINKHFERTKTMEAH